MTFQNLFDNFDLLADTPNAVAKMRELVLELAVRGKLVVQESSGVVLTEAQRHGGEFNKDDFPFPIPSEWQWTRLGSVGNIFTGNSTSAKLKQEFEQVTDGLPYIATKDVGYGKNELIYDNGLRVPISYPRFRIAHKNAVLICVEGGSAGRKIGITDRDICFGNKLFACEAYTGIEPYYIFYWYQSPTFFKEFQSRMTGIIGGISRSNFLSLPIPLPPLAEQKRIVAKVDELMALCDQLEAQQQEREQQKTVLSRAALARFTVAPTPANLELLFYPSPCPRASVSKTKKSGKSSHRGAEAQSENYPPSFNHHHSSFIIQPSSFPASPDELRKTILDLAVKGKLVPQDPKDEPARELIGKINLYRACLAKEQSVRLPKNVPSRTPTSYPYEIPESWCWSFIGHLVLAIDYGTSQKADSNSDKVPVYRMGNIVEGRLLDDNLKYVDATITDLPRLYLKTGDILFNRTNSYELVGKSGMYTGPDDEATFASYLVRVRFPDALLSPSFYIIAMNAQYFRQTQIEPEVVQQCGQANFNATKLASTVVPVPPLAEQKRIAAKVNELMALVDELEKQLAASRTVGEKLLTAIVAELTSSTPPPKNMP